MYWLSKIRPKLDPPSTSGSSLSPQRCSSFTFIYKYSLKLIAYLSFHFASLTNRDILSTCSKRVEGQLKDLSQKAEALKVEVRSNYFLCPAHRHSSISPDRATTVTTAAARSITTTTNRCCITGSPSWIVQFDCPFSSGKQQFWDFRRFYRCFSWCRLAPGAPEPKWKSASNSTKMNAWRTSLQFKNSSL